jgi:hypothetical protein
MTRPVVDVGRHRGRFFQVLQETAQSQTAVMTIAPGQDGGPAETHAGDQIVSPSRAPSTRCGPARAH